MGQELSTAISDAWHEDDTPRGEQQQQQSQPLPPPRSSSLPRPELKGWAALRAAVMQEDEGEDERAKAKQQQWVPDIYTSFAKEQARLRRQEQEQAAAHLGQSSLGGDSLQLLEERKYQSYVSRGETFDYRGRKPAVPVDSWLHQHLEEVQAQRHDSHSIGTADLQPAVGVDAWSIQLAKDGGKERAVAKAPRNALNLAASMGRAPTSTADTFHARWAKETKQNVSRGALKKGYVGVRGTNTTVSDPATAHIVSALANLRAGTLLTAWLTLCPHSPNLHAGSMRAHFSPSRVCTIVCVVYRSRTTFTKSLRRRHRPTCPHAATCMAQRQRCVTPSRASSRTRAATISC